MFALCSALYNLGPVVVSGCLLILRRRLAVSLPVVHSFFHLALVMVWIDVSALNLVVMDVLFEAAAAVFAALSACS